MKNIALIILLFTLSTSLLSQTGEILLSPSGQEFVFIEMPDNPKVTVQVNWPQSWGLVESEHPAAAYIGSRLMMESGNPFDSTEALRESFLDLGASAAIIPTADAVRVILTAPPENILNVVKLANAVLVQPRYDEQWFEHLKGQLKTNQIGSNNQRSKKAFDTFQFGLFGDAPITYSQSLYDVDAIDTLVLDDVSFWHKKIFTASGIRVVVTGSVSSGKATEIVGQLLLNLPTETPIAASDVETYENPRMILLHEPEIEVGQLIFIGKLPPVRGGSEFEDLIAVTLLGQGENSALFKAVREELRASYSYTATILSITRNLRYLVLSGEIDSAKLLDAHKVVGSVYENFRASPNLQFLSSLKKVLENKLDVASSNSMALANAVTELYIDGRDWREALNMSSLVNAISKDSVAVRVLEAFPPLDEMMVIVITSDPSGFSDACIISKPSEAVLCH